MIRPASPADIPLIIALDRQCPTAAHWTEDQYRQMFSQGFEGVQRLALVDEVLHPTRSGVEMGGATASALGFLVASHIAPEWELENIVVSPAARRKGIAKRLMDALLAAARETNSDSVFLEVRESNQAARGLYEKSGFVECGRRKSYYANPVEDAVHYRWTRR